MRIAGIGIAATAAGVAAAVAAGAVGGSGVPACAAKASGRIVAQSGGRCASGEFAITISGDAFARSKNRTLTINGVVFKKGSGKTITINGVSYSKGRGGTLTINGVSFKKSRGGTLTINGVSFKKGSGKTLTINGLELTPGAAGQQGPAGPPGPPGISAVRAGAPVVAPGPVDATLGGGAVALASAPLQIGDGSAHRVLIAGGFDAECVAVCPSPAQGVYDVARDGSVVFTRRLPRFSAAGITDMSGVFSEVVDAPAGCTPCSFTLRLAAVGPVGAGGASTLRATAIRLAVVDLGPAG